jgi:hypothetical protein
VHTRGSRAVGAHTHTLGCRVCPRTVRRTDCALWGRARVRPSSPAVLSEQLRQLYLILRDGVSYISLSAVVLSCCWPLTAVRARLGQSRTAVCCFRIPRVKAEAAAPHENKTRTSRS